MHADIVSAKHLNPEELLETKIAIAAVILEGLSRQ